MRLLLTGASGLVGGAVARVAAAQGHAVIGLVGRYPDAIPGLAEQHAVDLRDHARLAALMAAARPQAILHTAAVSEPGECDADPHRAEQLNARLPAELARLAARHRLRLVHLSTEQVFGGDRAPYAPSDPVAPLQCYGRTKAEGEQRVLAEAPNLTAVLRLPLLLGNSPSGRRSLHERLFADWMAGRTPQLFTDEIRQVAHADNVAAVMLELARQTQWSGVFHWAGTEPHSRFALGARIRDHFGLSPSDAPLLAVTRAERAAAAATRPADLRLRMEPLVEPFAVRPQNLQEQLSQLVAPPPCAEWWRRLSTRREVRHPPAI